MAAPRTINRYDVGETAKLSVAFTDENGTAVDPTTVACSVIAPDGTASTPSVTKTSTGNYYALVSVTQAGAWFYRFTGTGAVENAADEHQFLANETEF